MLASRIFEGFAPRTLTRTGDRSFLTPRTYHDLLQIMIIMICSRHPEPGVFLFRGRSPGPLNDLDHLDPIFFTFCDVGTPKPGFFVLGTLTRTGDRSCKWSRSPSGFYVFPYVMLVSRIWDLSSENARLWTRDRFSK